MYTEGRLVSARLLKVFWEEAIRRTCHNVQLDVPRQRRRLTRLQIAALHAQAPLEVASPSGSFFAWSCGCRAFLRDAPDGFLYVPCGEHAVQRPVFF